MECAEEGLGFLGKGLVPSTLRVSFEFLWFRHGGRSHSTISQLPLAESSLGRDVERFDKGQSSRGT